MPGRTTETTVTFRHPFMLTALERPQPEGTYRVVIEEDEITGLSFLAFRRTTTILQIPAITVSDRAQESYTVSASELAAALENDHRL